MQPILLEIPAELKILEAVLRDVVTMAATQVARAGLGGAVEYAGFERELSAKICEVERAVHHATLSALDPQLPQLLINDVWHRQVLVDSPTMFMTLVGGVEVVRSLYRPVGMRNGPSVDLVALRSGSVEGVWLPSTAREMAFELQRGTSREAEVSGGRLGRLPYSRSSFEHVAHAVGELYVQQHQPIEEALIRVLDVPDEAHTVSVSLDRVSVPMEESKKRPVGRPKKDAAKRPINRVYRMAYCGTVTIHDANGNALHTIRYGTMPAGDPEGLCAGLADDVVAILAQRPDLKVALLCDGAKEMWNLLDAEFTKAPFDGRDIVVERLIDFWHAIEKLAPAAKVIAGDAAAKSTLAGWKLRLRNSSKGRSTILAELVASEKEDIEVGTTKPVHDAITYFTNNAARMDYARARRECRPIGSGNVEATCKSLVGLRMKRPGSRWKSRTGEHILHLRALALSDRWDGAMDIVFRPPSIRIREIAA